eukprot:GILK01006074.1.p1 GENE.GILK01006074.1~~GILK01006074.1.p1  ORF type:complete len:343 (+),score=17.53 GILK01006074.1:39-1031(+)
MASVWQKLILYQMVILGLLWILTSLYDTVHILRPHDPTTIPGRVCSYMFQHIEQSSISSCTLHCPEKFGVFPTQCDWHAFLVDGSEVSRHLDVIPTMFLVLGNVAFLLGIFWCTTAEHAYYIPEALSLSCAMWATSLFHLCKDGPICFASYSSLLFIDAFAALWGFGTVFVLAASFDKLTHKYAAHSILLTACLLLCYRNPRDKALGGAVVTVLGVAIILVRHHALPRKFFVKDTLHVKQYVCGLAMLYGGSFINVKFQESGPYWILHGTWHILAATGGFIMVHASRNPHLLLYHRHVCVDAVADDRNGLQMTEKRSDGSNRLQSSVKTL